jgi:AraC-like DNA-binding protein/ligand-binding sensor protein
MEDRNPGRLADALRGVPLRADELAALEKSMTAFSRYTGVPVTYLDQGGAPVWELLQEKKLCSLFDMYRDGGSPCRQALSSAVRISGQLGEPYIFVCKAGFVNIAMPVLILGKTYGHFVAGPMVMGAMQESLLGNIFALTRTDERDLPRLMVFVRSMKDHTPKDVSHLSVLFGSCVLSSIRQNAEYSRLTLRNAEQQKVGEHLRMSKRRDGAPGEDPLERTRRLEDQLTGMIRSGDGEGAAALMAELAEELTLAEAGDLPSVKVKVLSLCTVLSRMSGEEELVYEMDGLSQTNTLEELVESACDFARRLATSFTAVVYRGNSQVIRSALEIIHRDYAKGIALAGLADTLHVNPSYLSSLFRRETGMSFTDYLNNYRVVKSRDLLARTGLPLVEIAALTGFEDQSYFSKTFRKFNEMTPTAFRRAHKGSPKAGG